MQLKINSFAEYEERVKLAEVNPENYWAELAENFTWQEKWQKICEHNLEEGKCAWFQGAKLNITENIIDRHLPERASDIAILWESNELDGPHQKITFQQLHDEVARFAHLLKSKNISKGDRVIIYMPMVPEAVYAMLACARIGAVHSVVFAGFSAKALQGRVNDCAAKLVITADYLYRGAKTLKLIDIVNDALIDANTVENVLLLKRAGAAIDCVKPVTIINDVIKDFPANFTAEIMDAEDPLFILYTSGSTGKPKGVLHSIAGYMLYTAYSFQNVFQYQQGQKFFCTADIGWITGHSYMVYGPLLSGATIIMFEGVPTYPTPSRFWQIIDKYQAEIFYTAPTAIRALMQCGDEYVADYDLSSLQVLGTVGEPINLEAWQWYNDKIGKNNCAIVDTWWQTETGGIAISPLGNLTKLKPCYATLPLPGIFPIIVDKDGSEITEPNVTGNLCMKYPWPSMIRSVWGDHARCIKTYFSDFKGYYFSGDGAYKDTDGYFRITGRVDDVINVSGHRLGTAEIEDAINMHAEVTESAVIGFPHEIKGEGIYAFVVAGRNYPELAAEIIAKVQEEIGAIAKPDQIKLVSDLPKTRSGKIMRRILRKIASGEEDLGDVSTLVNPDIVAELKGGR